MQTIVRRLFPLILALPVVLFVVQSAAAQDPTVVDSAHYTVDLETDALRVIRIKYGPGEESVMHHHPEGVAIALSDGTVHFSLPDGSEMDVTFTAGQVVPAPAGAHKPKNTGDSPIELVQIELKESEGMMEEN